MIPSRFFLIAFLMFWAAGPAFGQTAEEAQKRLDAVKASLLESQERRAAYQASAQSAEEEAETLAERLVQIGRRLRRLDTETGRLETRLGDLTGLKKQLVTRLAEDRESLVQLIAALERLGRRPAALSLFQPGSALDTARSVSLMSGMVPMINAQALDVRLDIESLLRVEAGLVTERKNLVDTAGKLQAARGELARLVNERKRARKTALAGLAAESQRQIQLQAEAKDLESLLAEIFSRQPVARPERDVDEQEETEDQAGSSAVQPAQASITLMTVAAFKQLKGQLIPPVSGQKTLRFGQLEGVLKAQGERRSARPGSEVLAPTDGRIVFSAPFRDFGEVLIIEHAEGYHSLLAGLNDRYAELGQNVLAGEPIGAMGMRGQNTASGEQKTTSPELYLELREKGRSVNPAPWYRK